MLLLSIVLSSNIVLPEKKRINVKAEPIAFAVLAIAFALFVGYGVLTLVTDVFNRVLAGLSL